MISPKERIRITLADEIPEISGIYILAYMGKIIYIGKSEDNVALRLAGHKYNAINELLGAWMIRCNDELNTRLDILTPPDNSFVSKWLRDAEAACILKFKPLLNEQFNPDTNLQA